MLPWQFPETWGNQGWTCDQMYIVYIMSPTVITVQLHLQSTGTDGTFIWVRHMILAWIMQFLRSFTYMMDVNFTGGEKWIAQGKLLTCRLTFPNIYTVCDIQPAVDPRESMEYIELKFYDNFELIPLVSGLNFHFHSRTPKTFQFTTLKWAILLPSSRYPLSIYQGR